MRIVEREYDGAVADAFVASGMRPVMARLLASRGVVPQTLERYLNPDFRDLASSETLTGIREAASTILDAIEAGRRMAVFGDYDCDGVCATAIMTRGLRSLVAEMRARGRISAGGVEGEQIIPFIPQRLGEGYGLGKASVARLFSEAPDVSFIVTVDNGITAVQQIDDLNARGVDVVVTDHHLPAAEIPRAKVIVNPKVSSTPELGELCGAAVAYFLANAIVLEARERYGDATISKGVGAPLFILAGLATVTDIMPLTLQNRILVAESLKRFHYWAPVGLKELYVRAARNADALGVRDFGFALGPRINAAGRLSTGMEAFKLLMCDELDREKARELALQIDLYNAERRNVEQKMTDAAMALVRPGAGAQVIAFSAADKENVHPGVAGVVASRVLDRLPVPVPVCVLVDGKGSLRAVAPYNVREALDAASASLSAYGGHALAAGVSVLPGQIESFRDDFEAACNAQRAAMDPDAIGTRTIDCWLDRKDLNDLSLAEEIARMEPFGEGNPEPVFALSRLNFSLHGISPFGNNGAHLQLSFRERNIPRAVWWGKGCEIERLRAESDSPHDIIFSLSISDFRGRHLELNVIDVIPSRV